MPVPSSARRTKDAHASSKDIARPHARPEKNPSSSQQLVTRSVFQRARKEKPPLPTPHPSLSRQSSKKRVFSVAEDISDAEDEEDEVVPLDDAPEEEPGSSGNEAKISELDALLNDTPLKRLQEREKAALLASKSKEGDPWLVVKLRQEALALAKLQAQSIKVAAAIAREEGVYEEDEEEPPKRVIPSLLAKAHFKLAKAYKINDCFTQTSEHCKQALGLCPPMDDEEEGADALKRFTTDVNATAGEAFLEMTPPKPQTALGYFFATAGIDSAELSDVSDPGVKICIAQCLVLLGDAKLREAGAVRNAKVMVEQRLSMLMAKMSEISRKKAEYEVQMTRIAETNRELNAESAYESSLLSEAREFLDKALEAVMDVIADEESRLRSIYTDLAGEIVSADKDKESRLRQEYIDKYKKHPVVELLWKLACDVMFKSSCVESLAGEMKAQLQGLQEIKSANEQYGCLEPDAYVGCLKEEGAARVKLACSMEGDDEGKEAELEKATDTYTTLLDYQSERYEEDEAMQATTRAETLKLLGNVCIARRQWIRARKHFSEAMETFSEQIGLQHNLVQDLDFRISDIDATIEATFLDAKAKQEALNKEWNEAKWGYQRLSADPKTKQETLERAKSQEESLKEALDIAEAEMNKAEGDWDELQSITQ